MRMKKWKRVTASALSICMLATCAPCLAEAGGILQTPVTAHAETGDIIVKGDCGDYATWNYNRTTKVMTITGRGYINLYSGNIFSRYRTEVKKIIISDRITEIGTEFFKDFTALEDIEFGGVKEIGYSAFMGCTSLKTLNLDGNIREIGPEAFRNCKSLTSVTVGSKVKDVYYDTFKGCNNLTSISINKDNKYVYVDGKELFSFEPTSGKCGKHVKYSYNKKTKTLTLSGYGPMYDGEHEIDEETLDETYYYPYDLPYEIKTLIVGDNITRIGTCAFSRYSSLENVKLGKNVSSIGSYAFFECDALKNIQSGNHLKSIEEGAFSECKKLKTFTIGESVNYISEGAFSKCTRLSRFNVHKNNKFFSTRDNMLLNKNQSKIVSACFGSNKTCNISGSVKQIDQTILRDPSVKRFSVSKNNTKYASKNGLLYSKDGKKLIKAPADKSGIINIDDTVTSINADAICDSNKITQINIGKNVKSLDSVLTYGDIKKLKKIQISSKNKYYYEANGSIISKANNKLIYCYKTEGDTYTIPEAVEKIGNFAFSAQTNLRHIILSDNVTKLGSYAFCVSSDPTTLTHIKLESIHLGKSCNLLANENYDAIDSIKSLKEVTVSSENPNYTSIDGVLYNKDVTKLAFLPGPIKTYTIPEGVTGIMKNCPMYMSSLRNLVLSDTITDADEWFKDVNELNSVHLGKNVNNIYTAFGYINLSNLKDISVSEENSNFKVVNNMLYSKDGSKFILCPALTAGKVVLENGVTEIGSCAFNGCTNITDIVIPDTVSKVADNALCCPSTINPELNTVASIVIWVPKGKLDYYKSLFTKKTGYLKNMLIMELEN